MEKTEEGFAIKNAEGKIYCSFMYDTEQEAKDHIHAVSTIDYLFSESLTVVPAVRTITIVEV